MTKRTQIAVRILQGLCSSPPSMARETAVKTAFQVADLVLAEEEKTFAKAEKDLACLISNGLHSGASEGISENDAALQTSKNISRSPWPYLSSRVTPREFAMGFRGGSTRFPSNPNRDSRSRSNEVNKRSRHPS